MRVAPWAVVAAVILASACTRSTALPTSPIEATHLELTVSLAPSQPSARPLLASITIRNVGSTPWTYATVMPSMLAGWQVVCSDASSRRQITTLWHQPDRDAADGNGIVTVAPGAVVTVQALFPNPGPGIWSVVLQSRQPWSDSTLGPDAAPASVQVVDDDRLRAEYDRAVGRAWAEFGVWNSAAGVLSETHHVAGDDPGWWLAPMSNLDRAGGSTPFSITTQVREPAFRSTLWLADRSVVAAAARLGESLDREPLRALLSALAAVPELPDAAVPPVLTWAEAQQEIEPEPEHWWEGDEMLAHLPAAAQRALVSRDRAASPLPIARRRLAALVAMICTMRGPPHAVVIDGARILAGDDDGRTAFLALAALTWAGDKQAGGLLTERLAAAPARARAVMGLHALTALPPAEGRALLKRCAKLPQIGGVADDLLRNVSRWPLRR